MKTVFEEIIFTRKCKVKQGQSQKCIKCSISYTKYIKYQSNNNTAEDQNLAADKRIIIKSNKLQIFCWNFLLLQFS